MAPLTRRNDGLISIRASAFCLVFTATFGLSVAFCSPKPSTFTIRGQVKTEKGRAFPKAVVMVDNEMGMTSAVFTRSDGRFVINGLLPGSYQVSADRLGYVKVTQTIVIPAAKPLSLVLRPAPPDRRKDSTAQMDEAMNVGPPARFLFETTTRLSDFDRASAGSGKTNATR